MHRTLRALRCSLTTTRAAIAAFGEDVLVPAQGESAKETSSCALLVKRLPQQRGERIHRLVPRQQWSRGLLLRLSVDVPRRPAAAAA